MYIANEINTSVNLIKFDKYYKENYRSYNLKVLLKDHLPQPIFDKNGKLIFKDNIITSNFRLLIGKIPYFKKIYKKIYQKINENFNKNIIVCGTRGSMLCAVLQKKI